MTRIWYRGRLIESPESWDTPDWAIPYAFLKSAEHRQDPASQPPGTRPFLQQSLVSGFEATKALSRRSITATSSEPIARPFFAEILRSLYQCLASTRHLFAGVITTNVEGWADAYWLLDHSPRHIRRSYTPYSPEQVARFIQGQGWANGAGIGIAIGLDWEYGQLTGMDPDVLYAEALVQVGRIGQALLYTAQHQGYAGRMTPAIHESTGQEMFELDTDRDCLYYLKLAKQRPPVE